MIFKIYDNLSLLDTKRELLQEKLNIFRIQRDYKKTPTSDKIMKITMSDDRIIYLKGRVHKFKKGEI